MTRGTCLLLTAVIGGPVILAATLGAGVAAVYHAGTAAVEIEDGGHQLRLRVPAGLLGAAVALAPASAIDDAASELSPFLPAIRAGWQELSEAPDFVLVEARSGDESVLIVKSGSRLEVSIDTPDSRVRVAVPLGTLRQVLRRLERRA
jgi:hypothetical protein